MSYLSDICCICLERKESLVSYTVRNDSELSYYEKIFIFIPQMCFSKITSDNKICSDCCKSIDNTINFRNMCLRNKDIIMEFVEEIASCEDEKNSDDLIVFKRSRIKDEDDDKGIKLEEISEGAIGIDKELEALKKLNDMIQRKKRRRLQRRYEFKRRRRICKTETPEDTITNVIESVVNAGNNISPSHLKRKRKYENRRFECQFCFQIIKHRPRFVEHYNVVHEGRRPYVCEICNKGFIEKYQLTNHMSNVHCK